MELAVDVGGTKIEAAIIYKGRVIKTLKAPTEASKGRKRVVSNMLSTIEKLNGKSIIRVGLSIAGIVTNKGILRNSPNLKCLEGLNIADELENRLGIPVIQENDANCFAIAEHKLGAAKNCRNVVGLIVGTGVGCGIIIDGELFRGVNGGAGEIGHTILDDGKTFEDLCSGSGILERYVKDGGRMENPITKDIFHSKDPVAVRIVEDTYEYLGKGIANIINTFNTEMVVLGGGVSNSLNYMKLRRYVKKYAIPELAKDAKIMPAKLGENSGVIGASFLR